MRIPLNLKDERVGAQTICPVTSTTGRCGINQLFARSVLERKIDGWAYVDQVEDPRVGYVLHPYGMALLFGETESPTFRRELWQYLKDDRQARKQDEWLQVYPEKWAQEIRQNCTGYEEHKRVNFRFMEARYQSARPSWNRLADGIEVTRTNPLKEDTLSGTVVPSYFWRSTDDFSENGVGFSVVIDGDIVSTAFSAFIIGDQLEIGIETIGDQQGKGYALWTCSALIDYCLANGYEPVWACRLENEASFRLAKKLGFEPTAYLPYFRFTPATSFGREA